MQSQSLLIICFFIVILFIVSLIILSNKNENVSNEELEKKYQKRSFMTNSEYQFYLKLKDLETKYKIVPQLSLKAIADKLINKNTHIDLFRLVDFAIFSYDYKEVLLLIELNDSTHNMPSRRARDIKVKNICNEIGVPLMTFYTNCSNKKEYILNRVLNVIEKEKNG